MNLLLTKSMYDAVSGKMVYKFPTMNTLSDMEVGLVHATFYNSFYNVSARKNNNKITFNFPLYTGASYVMTPYVLTIPDGYYSLTELNLVLQLFFVQNNLFLYDTVNQRNVYFADIMVNETAYKCQVNSYYIPNASMCTALGWTGGSSMVDPATGSSVLVAPAVVFASGIGVVLGCVAGTYTPPFSASVSSWPSTQLVLVSSTSAPAVNPVSSIIVSCNLVNSSYSLPTDMLAQIPLIAPFGGLNQFDAQYVMFTPAVNGNYGQVEVTFRDQDLNLITWLDTDITLTMQLRKKGSSA